MIKQLIEASKKEKQSKNMTVTFKYITAGTYLRCGRRETAYRNCAALIYVNENIQVHYILPYFKSSILSKSIQEENQVAYKC